MRIVKNPPEIVAGFFRPVPNSRPYRAGTLLAVEPLKELVAIRGP